MVHTVVWLLIICGVAALALWAVDQLGTPDPIRRVVRVVVVVVAVLIIIGLVATLFGVDTGMPKM
jgi:preprotein translocase subunit SecE